MTNIVILTGSELRHTYFRKALSLQGGIKTMRSYCETKPKPPTSQKNQDDHLIAREQVEQDFFGAVVALTDDQSEPVFIEAGDINAPNYIRDIIALKPDLIISYGCSIIKGDLLIHFDGRILNVHLGLSPYYRGTGTNFWPLVNNEPECVGATFMYMDRGIDTGNIIHQIRASIITGDGPHQIGNRLIRDLPFTFAWIIQNFDNLEPIAPPMKSCEGKLYRRKDFSPEATEQINTNFKNGMIKQYLNNKAAKDRAVPIVKNPLITDKVL